MALTQQDLSAPIDTDDKKFEAFLSDLQGNILKGHGRVLTANVFLRFAAPAAAKTLRAIARGRLTTAKMQLDQTAEFKRSGKDGGTVHFIFLSAAGYKALSLQAKAPNDLAFAAGMASRAAKLNDPPSAQWDAHLQGVHGLILIGDDTAKGLDVAVAKLVDDLDSTDVEIVGIEMGRARFNSDGNGIEHFGYVDGRSQPLLLQSDVDDEAAHQDGGAKSWDPAFNPDHTVLVRDTGGIGPDSFGSFLVFRKLDQNVQGFKDREQKLASALGLTGKARERAGAMVVGRFEDGTPFILNDKEQPGPGVPNDFNYDTDVQGMRCPFQAHIRKTNPRGDVRRQFNLPNDDGDRDPIMARRGIPYGVRSDTGEDIPSMPTGGVGLLFMAYQKSFERQFEFTQQSWANEPDFLRAGTRLDPVIGQRGGAAPLDQQWRATKNSPPVPFHFGDFVTMKGGEYFFAPSRSFLEKLK